MITRVNRHTHGMFWGLLTFLIALIFVRYALKIDIPRIVLSMLIVFIAVCVKRADIIAVAICCMPLHNAISFYVAISACAAICIVRHYNQVRLNFTFCLLLIAIIWELLHYINSNVGLVNVLAIIAPLIFMMAIRDL